MENKLSTNRRKGGVTTVTAAENKRQQEEAKKIKPQTKPSGDKSGEKGFGKDSEKL